MKRLVVFALVVGCSSSGTEAAQVDDAGDDVSTSTDSSTDSSADSVATDAKADDALDAAVDTTTESGVCSAPNGSDVYVAPTGSDDTGNGSASCPFKTIKYAINLATTAGGPVVVHLAAGTYGAGCTGGAPCDSGTLVVAASFTKGLVIRGAGAATTRVVGGTGVDDSDSVFQVLAPAVGFEDLTIAPRKLGVTSSGSATLGANGVTYFAPSAATEATVKNVVIEGVSKTASTEPTGNGIEIYGGTSPTIGPGVTISGGVYGILVRDAPMGGSKPIITSTAAAPTFIHSTSQACVLVQSNGATNPTATLTSTTDADPGRLHLQDCGAFAGIGIDIASAGPAVIIDHTLIDTSSATGTLDWGIVMQHYATATLGTATTITGSKNVGIAMDANTKLTTTAGVSVTKNHGLGLRISGNASATLDGLTVTENGTDTSGHGLWCYGSASMKLRNSTFLQNKGSGVVVQGTCAANLGSATEAGGNVFQRTSKKNGQTGLCYASTVAATATASTWSCGLAASAACTAATATTKPVLDASPNCNGTADYGLATTGVLTVAFAGQTCCGL